jgi:hypothetical protein
MCEHNKSLQPMSGKDLRGQTPFPFSNSKKAKGADPLILLR